MAREGKEWGKIEVRVRYGVGRGVEKPGPVQGGKTKARVRATALENGKEILRVVETAGKKKSGSLNQNQSFETHCGIGKVRKKTKKKAG